MSASNSSVRRMIAFRSGTHKLRELLGGVVLGAAAAGAVGHGSVSRLRLVEVVGILAVSLVIFASTAFAAVLLGMSIPALADLTGGSLGVHVAASDLMLVFLTVQLIVEAAKTKQLPALAALRRVRGPVLQYAVLVALLLILHLGLGSTLKSVQRLELLMLPLLVGAALALRRHHMIVVRAYVLATTLLAIVWPVLNASGHAGQWQKNPTGQLIANAILLIIGIRNLRGLLPLLPVLVVGLGLTASRGAIVSLIIGVAVISLVGATRDPRVVIPRTLLLVLAALVAYQLLPADVQSRVTSYSSAGTVNNYPIYAREQYVHDAERLIAQHPWTGIGVGNYSTTDPTTGTTTDPHNVLLLQAAEGGYLFAVSFIVLVGGVAFVLWRLRDTELAAAAAAVLLATVAHGLVDVYWVRGTPVLGWLLAGMVCGLAVRRPAEPATPREGVPEASHPRPRRRGRVARRRVSMH